MSIAYLPSSFFSQPKLRHEHFVLSRLRLEPDNYPPARGRKAINSFRSGLRTGAKQRLDELLQRVCHSDPLDPHPRALQQSSPGARCAPQGDERNWPCLQCGLCRAVPGLGLRGSAGALHRAHRSEALQGVDGEAPERRVQGGGLHNPVDGLRQGGGEHKFRGVVGMFVEPPFFLLLPPFLSSLPRKILCHHAARHTPSILPADKTGPERIPRRRRTAGTRPEGRDLLFPFPDEILPGTVRRPEEQRVELRSVPVSYFGIRGEATSRDGVLSAGAVLGFGLGGCEGGEDVQVAVGC